MSSIAEIGNDLAELSKLVHKTPAHEEIIPHVLGLAVSNGDGDTLNIFKVEDVVKAVRPERGRQTGAFKAKVGEIISDLVNNRFATWVEKQQNLQFRFTQKLVDAVLFSLSNGS